MFLSFLYIFYAPNKYFLACGESHGRQEEGEGEVEEEGRDVLLGAELLGVALHEARVGGDPPAGYNTTHHNLGKCSQCRICARLIVLNLKLIAKCDFLCW